MSTDQNSKFLEKEGKTSITLVTKSSAKYKKWRAISFNLRIEYMEFSRLLKNWVKTEAKI